MAHAEISHILKTVRKHNRIAVSLPVKLNVSGHEFSCMAYDVSLGGVRVKVDAPIAENDNVSIFISENIKQTAKVVWISQGFVGLDFNENPKIIKEGLGSLAANLN